MPPKNNKPFLSVVIPTYQRESYLKQVLHDLSRQTQRDFEVIVVDQNDSRLEFTSEPACRRGREKPPRCRQLKFSPPSIVKAKNYGISKAKGNIILILDDDLRLPKDLIERYLSYWSDPSYSYFPAIAGPALEEDKFIIKRGGSSFGEFSIFGELNTDYRSVRKTIKVAAVPGGNLSFKKKVWERVGGYDENFRGNCINEDSDFCLRISKKFGKITFDPALTVTHLRAEGGSRAFSARGGSALGEGSATSAQWYEDLFFNHLYFYLKHWPKCLLPLFFLYRMRQVYTCVAKYGGFRKDYVLAPIRGYHASVGVYHQSVKC
jgi:glycosyltransferase involved in cell wall biosynthesis